MGFNGVDVTVDCPIIASGQLSRGSMIGSTCSFMTSANSIFSRQGLSRLSFSSSLITLILSLMAGNSLIDSLIGTSAGSIKRGLVRAVIFFSLIPVSCSTPVDVLFPDFRYYVPVCPKKQELTSLVFCSRTSKCGVVFQDLVVNSEDGIGSVIDLVSVTKVSRQHPGAIGRSSMQPSKGVAGDLFPVLLVMLKVN